MFDFQETLTLIEEIHFIYINLSYILSKHLHVGFDKKCCMCVYIFVFTSKQGQCDL